MRLFALILLLSSPSSAVVTLPVEVMGAAGTTKKVTLTIPKGKGKLAARLTFTAHGLREGKASVQAGTGPAVILSNSTAEIAEPGKSFGGIGGGFSVLNLSVPVSGIKDGGNVVSFRFNGTDGINSGFRIIRLQIVDAVGAPLIPANQFKDEDPATWTPPLSDAGSIAEGKKLWEEARLLTSPLIKSEIAATCADCHTRTGFDLKYFNYSNYSIIKRSEFHGLTNLQGQQIASYIRTLNGTAPGRPWNPPYQPGPGTEAKPVTSWAAGAGWQAVLKSDSELLPYLSRDAIRAPINLRQTPIAMQFPDWNHWLPRVHPKDAWGDEFGDSAFALHYETVRETLAGVTDLKAYAQEGKLQALLSGWHNRRQQFLSPKIEGWTAWTPAYAEQIYSVAQWHLVKTFEVMQEFGLEGYGLAGNERTWYGIVAFFASPNMLKIPSTVNGLGGSPLNNEYFASVWYHVQAVLNIDNQGKPSGQSPMDWAYTYGKLKDLFGVTGYAEPMRLSLLLAKAMQVWDNAAGLDMQAGWSPHNKADVSRLVHFSYKPMWENVVPQSRAAVMQALVEAWQEKNAKYTPQQFYAGGYADPTYKPVANYQGNFGDKTAYLLPEFKAYGVDGALLDRVSSWAGAVWPLGPFKTGPVGTGD